MKVCLDTNVWLSATVFSGLCEDILLKLARQDSLLTSPLVRAEAHDVLARKFPQIPQPRALFHAIWTEATCVRDVDGPRGNADVGLIRAVQAAGADLFVTGDQRVLGCQSKGKMQIHSPREAWTLFFAQRKPQN